MKKIILIVLLFINSALVFTQVQNAAIYKIDNDSTKLGYNRPASSIIIDKGNFDIWQLTGPADSTQTLREITLKKQVGEDVGPGLEILTEDGQTGRRLYGVDSAYYGTIGQDAVDLSFTDTPNFTWGAMGNNSFAAGFNIRCDADNGTALGYQTQVNEVGGTAMGHFSQANGTNSMAVNYYTTAAGTNSFACNSLTTSQGMYSFASGKNTIAMGESSTAIGERGKTLGRCSFVGGYSHTSANYAQATGTSSFVFQEILDAGVHQAQGHNSVILGGLNHKTVINAKRSVILGGDSVRALQPDMVYIPGLKFWDYSNTDISNLFDSELGTIIYNSDKDILMICSDATPGANIWDSLVKSTTAAAPSYNPVYAEKYLMLVTETAPANTFYTVQWQNSGNSSGPVTSDSTIVVKEDGIYLINISGSWSMDVSEAKLTGYLYINDVQDVQTGFEVESDINETGLRQSLACNGIVNLTTDDILKLKVKVDKAGDITVYTANWSLTKVN